MLLANSKKGKTMDAQTPLPTPPLRKVRLNPSADTALYASSYIRGSLSVYSHSHANKSHFSADRPHQIFEFLCA